MEFYIYIYIYMLQINRRTTKSLNQLTGKQLEHQSKMLQRKQTFRVLVSALGVFQH